MELIVDFFLISMTAIFVENAVFTRALGTGKMTVHLGKPKKMLLFGVVLVVVNLLSALAAWGVNEWLAEFENPALYRPLLFVLCICVVYTLLWLVLRYVRVDNVRTLREMLPMAAFNCSVLGSLLLSAGQLFHLKGFLAFGFGTAVGYVLALFIVDMGMKRLAVSNVPKAFRGIPAVLLYIGLLSLGFYGLVGHQLPV